MVFWRMRIRSLNLYEALGADGLVTTSSLVQIRRVVEKADGALGSILIQKGL